MRAASILAVSAIIAAVASSFDVIRDFGSFHASLLTGSPGGAYYILGSQLAERAKRDRSRLDIVATAGSLENVSRLIADRGRCVEQFAFVQDGTPVRLIPGSNYSAASLIRSRFCYWARTIAHLSVSLICAALPLE